MNEIKIFENPEFGSVRTVEIDGGIWFVGKDVADILGYSNPRDALKNHVDPEDKNTVAIHDGIQGNPNVTVINESGLYSLVLSSKMPKAKEFKRWVTAEVLPSIRKHGGYLIEQESMTGEELLSKALIYANNQIGEKNNALIKAQAKIEEDRPKVIFADSVAASNTSILVRDLAKNLIQNDVKIGEKKLFEWFREHGYISKHSTLPTQKAVEKGLFEIEDRVIIKPTGKAKTVSTPRVTPKGRIYFTNLFLGKK